MDLYDYNRWQNFTKKELICSHTGYENPHVDLFIPFMDKVQLLRSSIGVAFDVTSCYRHYSHPAEARKEKSGWHSLCAIDFRVPITYAWDVLDKAIELEFYGIGINWSGDFDTRFIHLDGRSYQYRRIWSYS